ncbi:hypothetical protein EXIGLDRAFT_771638 [Exidia glandulosa HHB12029]|uniref:Uncharacterized protein n=1 Tax=Exidia glandulosa HHB12029 TaxID=1314781 RepID=A0A165FVC0_EXIGL|nr:hypothetical protein EXIGLDRAFT_771638 [Exidia glandulosa HHB12029]
MAHIDLARPTTGANHSFVLPVQTIDVREKDSSVAITTRKPSAKIHTVKKSQHSATIRPRSGSRPVSGIVSRYASKDYRPDLRKRHSSSPYRYRTAPDPMGTSRADAARLASAQNARAQLARMRAVKRSEKENAPRVSLRSVEKLETRLSAATSTAAALQERTNILQHQRDAHAQAKLRQQSASETQRAALLAAHSETVTALSSTVATLEGQLSEAAATILDLRKKLKAAEMRLDRFEKARDDYCERTVARKVREATTLHMKISGRYTDPVRDLVADLVCLGNVPTEHVPLVIQLVADCAGLTLSPARLVSPPSVRRFVREVGLGSEIQAAEGVNKESVSSLCFGADGTSDRKMQFMARHITAMYGDGSSQMFCLGIERPVDHTAAVTHAGWLNGIDTLADVHDGAAAAIDAPDDDKFTRPRFWKKFVATNSDHASDMGSTSNMLVWTRDDQLILFRGLDIMEAMTPEQYRDNRSAELVSLVHDLGGSSIWEGLSDDARALHLQRLDQRIARRLGLEAFNALSPEEQAEERVFVRAGCCMHKDLNAVLYATKHMATCWPETGSTPPLKLLNRDNAAAAAAGSAEAQAHAEEVSQGGAVKGCELAGCLFNNGDWKKGCGDPLRVYFTNKYTVCPTIPDTHQCRFQSTYEMARFLLRYRLDLLDFLELQRLSKTTRTFNNLEQNVWSLLNDGPTLSELVALAAYGTTIGRPYTAAIRASGLVNMMELMSLHDDLISLVQSFAQCPLILCSELQEEDFCPSTLDGSPSDDPWLPSLIADLSSQGLLPNLENVLKFFFTGAHKGWTHFSAEFLPGGAIASLSEKDRARIFIPATNDSNEGLLGTYRVWKRLRPTMRLRFFNAAVMYRRNRTRAYMRQLDPRVRRYIRKETRRRESLKLSKKEDDAHIAFTQEKRREGAEAVAKAAARVEKRECTLNEIAAIRFRSLATLLRFEENKRVTGSLLDKNILWHRYRGTVETIRKLKKTRPLPTRVAGKRALLESILRFQSIPSAFGDPDDPFSFDGSFALARASAVLASTKEPKPEHEKKTRGKKALQA